jgi:hypothetical protein
MSDDSLLITPQTKVGELLKAYPQLEDTLIEIAPAFKKLRNPVLRRTVAKVTSLAQAARVGNVSVVDVVQRLRQEVGQPEFVGEESVGLTTSSEPPAWFDEELIAKKLDARPMIDAGEQPIGKVLRDLEGLTGKDIYELITPFEPAPLIDKAKEKGMAVWFRASSTSEYHTYFSRI